MPSERPYLLLGILALTFTSVLVTPVEPLEGQDAERIESAVQNLKWREIGPTIMGGRISDIAAVEADPSTFYVATATGGVWKTENGGTGFREIFRDQSTSSVGDVTLAPSNPNVVWVGTGEPQNRQSSPWGHGVYRSLDAGRSWTHMGLENTHHIARIQVHPRDPDVVYVAAVGHLWGSNPERGVYRTTDGGQNWEKVLYVDEHTGAIDLVMDPGDPSTLFAAMYQRQRTAWGFNGGGPGSGLYRTLDGGDSWQELTHGLPAGDKGRIGVDIYRRDGNVVMAIVEADPRRPGQRFGSGDDDEDRASGVYKSTDRGESWEQVSTTNNRPMYYSQIRIDPNDPARIYLGGSDLYRSSDGGHEFTDDAADGVHPDHHALWIDPHDSDHLILGSDGGVSVSWDRGDSWRQLRNLPIAQFYEISVDMQDPYHVCGGLQDNGSWCAPSDTRSSLGIRTRHWYNVGSGDGFFTVPHPGGAVMFAESQGGNLTRVNLRTMERARIQPVDTADVMEGEEELRWNWNTPVVLSSHDPNTVYVGSNYLYRSSDLGMTWERISPDLTYAIDRNELEIMGVKGSEPQMSRNDGAYEWGNLTAIAESHSSADVIYTGSDDGRIQVTRDGGASWTDLTPNVPGLPEHTYVTRIVASRDAPGKVYAAFDGHRNDDFAAYVYVSENYGASWRQIVSGLPASSVNALAQHPRSPDLLFVGNEVGVWFSLDGGARWHPLDNNLPTVPVDDIEIQPRENDLVLGTHGRGIWIMSDLGPLEALSQELLAADAHLFPTRRATLFNSYNPQGWTPGIWEAENPPNGALINYYVGEDLGSEGAVITILDSNAEPVRELRGPGRAGIQRVEWDLRFAPPYEAEPGQGGGFFFRRPRGPKVLPGSYTVRLEAAGQTMETPLEVRLDPRVEISDADLVARQQALMDAYHLDGPAHEAEQALERVKSQLDHMASLLAEMESAPEDLVAAVDGLHSEVEELTDDLDNASYGSSFEIEGTYTRPTQDQLWELDQAWSRVPPIIERVNRIVTQEMPALYDRLNQEGVRPDTGEPVEVPRRGSGM